MLDVLLTKKPKDYNAYGFIYKITNLVNNKVYIGQTTLSVQHRYKMHCRPCTRGFRMPICYSIQKYGPEMFKVEIISVCSNRESLNKIEIKCIKLFNSLSPNGYNLSTGGHTISPETAKKVSEALKGRPKSEAHKKSTGLGNKGKKRTPQMCENQKLIKAHLSIPVKAINIKTGETTTFPSISECARITKVFKPNIKNVINGVYKQCNGFRFERLN